MTYAHMHYFVLCHILVSLHHNVMIIEKYMHCEYVLCVIFSVRNVILCLFLHSRLTNIFELNDVWFD